MSKNRSQKLIKSLVPEQQSPACVFVLYGLHMYTCIIQQLSSIFGQNEQFNLLNVFKKKKINNE